MRSLYAIPPLFLAAVAAVPAAAEEQVCSAATAQPSSVASIIAGEGASGDCVTVAGVAWKGALYDDVAPIYAEPRRARDPRGGGNRMAFYPPYRTDDEGVTLLGGPDFSAEALGGFAERARYVTVTGTLEACRYGAVHGARAALPFKVDQDACNGPGGMRLSAAAVMIDTARAAERLRPGQGAAPRLVPLAADSPWTPRFEAAADDVIAALRTRDAAQWVPLFGGKWLSVADRAHIQTLLSDRKSPFQHALFAKGFTHRRIFGWRIPATLSDAERQAMVEAPEAEALVCWSSHGDADKLWPLAAFDADNAPGRPYACARIAYSVRGDAPTWRAFIEAPPPGLAEPGI